MALYLEISENPDMTGPEGGGGGENGAETPENPSPARSIVGEGARTTSATSANLRQ